MVICGSGLHSLVGWSVLCCWFDFWSLYMPRLWFDPRFPAPSRIAVHVGGSQSLVSLPLMFLSPLPATSNENKINL